MYIHTSIALTSSRFTAMMWRSSSSPTSSTMRRSLTWGKVSHGLKFLEALRLDKPYGILLYTGNRRLSPQLYTFAV